MRGKEKKPEKKPEPCRTRRVSEENKKNKTGPYRTRKVSEEEDKSRTKQNPREQEE